MQAVAVAEAVADYVHGLKSIEDLLDDDLFWLETEADLKALVNASTAQLVMDSYKNAAGQLKLAYDFDSVNTWALGYAQTYTNAWWEQFYTSTQNQLREALVNSVESGAPLSDLTKRLEDMFSPARAKAIAATETTRIYAEASMQAYADAKVLTVNFNTVGGFAAGADAICVDIEAKNPWQRDRVPLPPQHVNCRCWITPVEVEQMEPNPQPNPEAEEARTTPTREPKYKPGSGTYEQEIADIRKTLGEADTSKWGAAEFKALGDRVVKLMDNFPDDLLASRAEVYTTRAAALREKRTAIFDEYSALHDKHFAELFDAEGNRVKGPRGVWTKLDRLHKEADKLLNEIQMVDKEAERILGAKRPADYLRGEKFLRVLSDIRSMGGDILGVYRGERLREIFEEQVMRRMPTDWIEASNNLPGMLNVRWVEQRGHYDHRIQEIAMERPNKSSYWDNTDYVYGGLVHEFLHRMEGTLSKIGSLEGEFYATRTAGEALLKLSDAFPGAGYRSHELYRPDEFLNPYMGKDYTSYSRAVGMDFFELITMGAEDMFGIGGRTYSIWDNDRDMVNFIAGMFAGI